MASLLSAQEAPPSAADLSAKVIAATDTNGDGSLSLGEVESALGADTTSGADALGAAFSSVDSNGDGQISADELTTALEVRKNAQSAQGAYHHHAHHAHQAQGSPQSSSNLAARILGAADTDGDGNLTAAEIGTAVGGSSSSGGDSALTSAIASLDSNGDGQLNAAELTAGIDAFRAAHHWGNPSSTAPGQTTPTTQVTTA